jgi:hypothetical protein
MGSDWAKDWQARDWAAPSPHFIKRACLLRNGIPNATWVETGTFMGETKRFLSAHAVMVYSLEPEPRLFANAAAAFGLLQPLIQRLRRVAYLARYRDDRRPPRRMLMLVIHHHPHRAGTHLRRKLVRCLARHGSTFPGVGASDKPGAVQISEKVAINAGLLCIAILQTEQCYAHGETGQIEWTVTSEQCPAESADYTGHRI